MRILSAIAVVGLLAMSAESSNVTFAADQQNGHLPRHNDARPLIGHDDGTSQEVVHDGTGWLLQQGTVVDSTKVVVARNRERITDRHIWLLLNSDVTLSRAIESMNCGSAQRCPVMRV